MSHLLQPSPLANAHAFDSPIKYNLQNVSALPLIRLCSQINKTHFYGKPDSNGTAQRKTNVQLLELWNPKIKNVTDFTNN
jgi:hypothetical protein